MQVFEFIQRKAHPSLVALGMAGVLASTGCAPMVGQPARAPDPVAKAVAAQPLPEQSNESRYAAPVAETEVVEVYGYPLVTGFESRAL